MPATATVTSARLSLGEVDRHVAARPRRLRRELGLTQQRLASLVGISVQQAHEYETRAGLLPADRLAAVAAALGVGVEYFLGASAATRRRSRGPGGARRSS